MFSLVRKAAFGRCLLSYASYGHPAISLICRGYAETAAVRRKPSKRMIELAQDLMKRGAPKIEGGIATLSAQEIEAWIEKITKETDIDLPPTKPQLALVQAMVNQGVPNADKLREGMTWRELKAWIDEAKDLGWKRLAFASHIESKQRNEPATAAELAYAREMAAYAGLEVPYAAGDAKRGEVANLIAQARAELIRQKKSLRGPAVPSGPSTWPQRVRLRKLGAQVTEGLTWGEAEKRLQELHALAKARRNERRGTAASGEKGIAKEAVERDLVEESPKMKSTEEVDRARSEEDNPEWARIRMLRKELRALEYSAPSTQQQTKRLLELSAQLLPRLTWGEAHERLKKLERAVKSQNVKSSGTAARAKKANGKEIVGRELVKESAEMKSAGKVDGAKSKEETAEGARRRMLRKGQRGERYRRPAAKWQKDRLRELGAQWPEGLTWVEADERLKELRRAAKRLEKKDGGAAASTEMTTLGSELAERREEMKLTEAVDGANSEKEKAAVGEKTDGETGSASAEGGAAEGTVGQGSRETPELSEGSAQGENARP
ncbi:hypothetical protein CALCODRAFT_204369 [Calocera cornea HHB12733]|uniref:Uncharacterized protein n=1 Tax=Calocera cornea HHB12733 TaxID=1353952 RepID=A0A165JZV4_9BASI|nr:hypothetical protein CALCODRAFT_204369 [Calocera cornea HHB12733]